MPGRTMIAGIAAISLLAVVVASGADETPQEWKNEIGMEFVLIPDGTFKMGAPRSFVYAPETPANYSRPVHQVTISKPFYIGKYEVMQGEWEAVMGENPSHFKECGERCPVESITWEQAQEFIRKLNEKEGSDKYRLPTEAEWEYAARGGNKKDRYGPLKDIAWSRSNGGNRTHPVGEKAPNGFGLYDTLGNVAEFVQDWFGAYRKTWETDPTGPEEGPFRVRRGHCGIGERYKVAAQGRVGCRVYYRGYAPRVYDSGLVPVGGGVAIGLKIEGKKLPPASDEGVGFRLLRVVE